MSSLWNFKARFYHLFRSALPFCLFFEQEKRNLEKMTEMLTFPIHESLDIGSGVGDSLDALPRSSIQYAVDISISMLRQLKSQYDYTRMSAADAQALPFRSSAFDFVSAIGVVEYISDPEKFLRETARCLHPDGFLLITMAQKNVWNQLRRVHGHTLYLYRPDAWEKRLWETGWKIVGQAKSLLQHQYLIQRKSLS